jgi:hypothetical protein
MPDPLRAALEQIAALSPHEQMCRAHDIALEALAAVSVEPRYEWRVRADGDEEPATMADEAQARRWRECFATVTIERRVKAGEWERVE